MAATRIGHQQWTRLGLAVLVAYAAVGVASGTTEHASHLASQPKSGVVPAGAAPRLGADITPIVEGIMQLMVVPGAVVYVRTPSTTWQHAFGTRTIGKTDPVTVNDYFRVGSTTKTMVGTIALQLVREGKLALDDPVSKYWPGVPNGSKISIAELMEMRSGLFSYNESESVAETMDDDPGRTWQPEELLQIGLSHRPYFAPGADFRYSNTNTILLALIIEKVAGADIGSLLWDRIYHPLGLSHTSFPARDNTSIPSPSPHGYLFGTNVSALRSPIMPDSEVMAARAGTLRPTDVTSLNPSWIWAAGAAISTAADLAAYVRVLVGGTDLLGRDLQQQRLDSAHTLDRHNPATIKYGLGLESFGPMLGHDGAIPGFQTFMGYDPVDDVTIVVLCTMRDGPAGGRPANEIAYGIVRKLNGE